VKKTWTEKDISAALQLKGRGLSEYDIAEKLGRTFASVNSKMSKLKLEGKLPVSEVPASR
jgi:biotin operon repressor